MEAGEVNKRIRGQEEVGDDGRYDVQLRCKRKNSACVSEQGEWGVGQLLRPGIPTFSGHRKQLKSVKV